MLQIRSDFPGGNIVVNGIDQDTVRVHQDLRDTTHDWFYWCFGVCGAGTRTVRFQFTRSRAIGVRGPGVSLDRGRTWAWLGSTSVQDNAFAYAFPATAPEVRFSFGMPYQASHWNEFVAPLSDNRLLSLRRLCLTAKGREVEYALLGCCDREPTHRVAITCRHHCCEMMASYVLEGLVQWIATAPEPDAEWLRRNVAFFIVPFVDKDGVEDGDQGKNRKPRDHGRDYAGESLYASTAAIRRVLPEWAGNRLRVAFDLHCPWIAGTHNEVIYLVGSQQEHIAQEQKRFTSLLEARCGALLPVSASDFLPFGTAWNTAENYAGGTGFAVWSAQLRGVRLATGIEIPYANVSGLEVNAASARLFGRDLAVALAAYLRLTASRS